MTTIGTPFSTSATKILLCGSGELGKEVVIELQRYGCEVIACDRYENAPAMQVADRSYTFSMLDGAELLILQIPLHPEAVMVEGNGFPCRVGDQVIVGYKEDKIKAALGL